MKLHLPKLFIGLVFVVMGASYATEVPLEQESDLADYANNETNIYEFLVKNDLNFTPESNPHWDANTPLITNGVLTFTSTSNAGDEQTSLSFNEGKSYAFLISVKGTSLIFDSLKGIELSENAAGTVCLQADASISFENISDNAEETNDLIFQNNTAGEKLGGAIAGGQYSVIKLKNNGNILFQGNNTTSSSQDTGGGAIYLYCSSSPKGCLSITHNKSITFSNNIATATGSHINGANGGAIYTRNNTDICNNTLVLFEKNCSINTSNQTAKGGAITIASKDLNISNNGIVIFQENNCSSESTSKGGAIYLHSSANLFIEGNQEVVFEKNYERTNNSYKLNSIYGDGAGTLSLAAKTGGSITFYDSVYWSGGAVKLNANYTDAEGKTQTAGGDIIFSGAKTAEHLVELKQNAASTTEINNSRTSTFASTITLQGGTLQVVDDAILVANSGLVLTAGSDSTLLLRDATIEGTSLTFNSETTLELHGSNTLKATLTLNSGANLNIGLTTEHANSTQAALKIEGKSINFSGSNTLYLTPEEALRSGRYNLLTLSSKPTTWTADKVSVSGSGQTQGTTFEDLKWENGTLYYEIGQTVWKDTDGVWSANEADGCNETYFGDSTAGRILLDGDITPGYVVVDNNEGNDYNFAAAEKGGKLTGSTALLKQGSGTLTIETANTYTGGTILEEGTLEIHNDLALGTTANGSEVRTAKGTLLRIGEQSEVVLAGENDVQGTVEVTENSTLVIQNRGYASEASQVNGTLYFSGESANAEQCGELSGSGTIIAENSRVAFSTASQYSGNIQVLGKQASLSINDMLCVRKKMTVQDGASVQAKKIQIEQNAVLSAELVSAMEEQQVALMQLSPTGESNLSELGMFNTPLAGELTGEALTLSPGSTYRAMGAHLGLGGGQLILNVSPESNEKIDLVLEIAAGYTTDSQVLLFSGVNELVFEMLGETYATADSPSVFSFNAADFFTGPWITSETQLIYDTQAQWIYLQRVSNVIPEPTTSVLGITACIALAYRRRRK